MKWFLVIVLAICLLLPTTTVLASTPIPLSLAEEYKFDGLMTFSVRGYQFADECSYYENKAQEYDPRYWRSGNTHQYMLVTLDYQNLKHTDLNAKQLFSGNMLFDDEYSFDGDTYQVNLNMWLKAPCTFEFPIATLEQGMLYIMFIVPNAVETSNASIVLYLTVNQEEFELKLR